MGYLTTIDRFNIHHEVLPNGCWRWRAHIDRKGYPIFSVDRKAVRAHRWSYETFVGPIPEGFHVDHTCHPRECNARNDCPHRRCVNPAHLEVKTAKENILASNGFTAQYARRTHCSKGHEYTAENTYRSPTRPTVRRCVTCKDEWLRVWRAAHPDYIAPGKR